MATDEYYKQIVAAMHYDIMAALNRSLSPEPKIKTDCYWYEEEPDMGARIPFCKLKSSLDPVTGKDCEGCKDYHSKYSKTNADRIRSMTDEELAEFMCHNVSNGTVNCAFCSAEEFCRMGHNGWLDWMKQEVENGNT